MTKSELLAYMLAKKFLSVGEPLKIEEVGNLTWYQTNVFEAGIVATDGIKTGYRRNVSFYVIDEGLPTETAYMDKGDAKTSGDINNNIDDIGDTIYKLYMDPVMRHRVIGHMLKAAYVILGEDPATVNHAVRLAIAKAVLANPDSLLNTVMAIVANNMATADLATFDLLSLVDIVLGQLIAMQG